MFVEIEGNPVELAGTDTPVDANEETPMNVGAAEDVESED